MGRVVDVDKLLEDIKNHCAMPSWCYAVIAAEMDAQPTVEAVPVVELKAAQRELADLKLKINKVICKTTKLPCCYCQPVCSFRKSYER